MQDLDALQPGAVAALQALPGTRQALLRRGQALLLPQLEEAPVRVQCTSSTYQLAATVP